MSTTHQYNTRSKKQKDTVPIPIPYPNTRSTDMSKIQKTIRVLLNKVFKTTLNLNDRVEKMIKLMRYIRTHKKILVNIGFKNMCFLKCHSLRHEATSSDISTRVKSKLLKSLLYECSLILDIIKNEF
jgi:hypothetical protein